MSRDAAKIIMEVITRNITEQDDVFDRFDHCAQKASLASTGG